MGLQLEYIARGIIINIASSAILLISGFIYLRFRRPQVKIHKYISAYMMEKEVKYHFKIVNTSNMQEARDFSIKLRGVKTNQWALNVFVPLYKEILAFNVTTLIQLDRHTRYSLIKCVKTNNYSYAASYMISTYEPLEEMLKTKYSYLQLVVRYTNTNNKEYTVKQRFTMEEIKPGHHTNDDKIENEPVNTPAKLYYFAYGSNLNKEQMKERCPGSKEVGSAILPGYELKFQSHKDCEQGYLTVEKNRMAKVPVGIYEISENDEKNLDGFEGAGTHYKKERIAIKYKNKFVSSNYIVGLIYTMIDGKECKPRDEYYNRVKTGYDEWKFNISYLRHACYACGYSVK